MAPLDSDKYLRKLRELRTKHAMEVVTRPGEITEKNYAYAVGFQSGLDKAEKIVSEMIAEAEEIFKTS